MNKKTFVVLVLAVLSVLPGYAVLKEDSISNTLSILRTELTNYHNELEQQSGFWKEQQERVGKNLMEIMNKSNQNSLMLYSQKPDYIFDLTYACHEATEQYVQFQKNVLPFRSFVARTNTEIARYDSLISNLNQMVVINLSERAKIDRNVCLTLAVNIRRTLVANNDQLNEYIHYYKLTEQHLSYLNDYANKRYRDIQTSIFKNGGDNYFTILSRLGTQIQEMCNSMAGKYLVKTKVRSQWDISVIFRLFFYILIYCLIAVAVSWGVIRYLMPRRLQTEAFMAKRTCIILAESVITLAVLLWVIRLLFPHQNFIIMASGLLVGYAWLLGVVLISLLLRLNGTQIKSGFRIYSPLIFIGFVVIVFRIVLIPNDLVNLIFPPILLVCMLWQWKVISRHYNNIPRSDVFYTYISLMVFISAVASSWGGYTLLSVQMLIWWIMQLTCILTITCLRGFLSGFREKKDYDNKPITDKWIFNLVYEVVLPIMGVFSVIISIYWATDVFNLSDTSWMIFTNKYVDTKNFSISIFSISQVVILYFVFRYINRTARAFLKLHFEQSDMSTAASRNVMTRNVVQVIVWGIWVLISLSIFHVNNSWIGYISVGLTTGLGIASKDILENIYYGISLMTGRMKIGDLIECDGTRGRVSSISYTSTMVDTVDGSVIAFQNSQLFSKNYKNLTRNHGYELDVLEVGVAYGTDISKVKQLLIDELMKLDCVYKKRGVNVVLKSFGDNSLILKILVWVPVITQYADDGKVLECVYQTLNEHGIEIPFPQRDIHVIHASDATVSPMV